MLNNPHAVPHLKYEVSADVKPREPHALTTRFPVFLSSVCMEDTSRPRSESKLQALRTDIFETVGMKTHVYVDECLFEDSGQDHMATIDRLVPRIRDCDEFVGIIAPRRPGSQVKIESAISSVTFFEMELFQASLSFGRKPVHVFLLADGERADSLDGVWRLVQTAFPDHHITGPLPPEDIKTEIRKLIETPRHLPSVGELLDGILLPTTGARFVRALDAMREGLPYSNLRLLDGRYFTGGDRPSGSAFDTLMAQVRSEPNAEKRLSRLWLVLRELMHTPYSMHTKDQTLLRRWEEVLRLWATAGAWYGLHGHTPIGTLAALNSAEEVSALLSSQAPINADQRRSGSGLASAKYSIGRRLQGPRRSLVLNEALKHAKDAFLPGDQDESGLRLVTASILLNLGYREDAMEHFHAAYSIQTKSKTAKPHEIGQAMSELGYGYLRTFHLRRGLELCEESIPLLRQTDNLGFLARGLRKLCWAYRLNLSLFKAHAIGVEWKQLVEDNGLYDQSP